MKSVWRVYSKLYHIHLQNVMKFLINKSCYEDKYIVLVNYSIISYLICVFLFLKLPPTSGNGVKLYYNEWGLFTIIYLSCMHWVYICWIELWIYYIKCITFQIKVMFIISSALYCQCLVLGYFHNDVLILYIYFIC